MNKRTARALALVLSATPLLLIGCGDSGNNNGTGGSGGGVGGAVRYDGGGGAGGAKLDVGAPDTVAPALDTAVALDTAPVNLDVALPIDSTPMVDGGIADAPIGPDAPIQLDTATLEAPKALDTGAADTFVAVDSPPVCTMTKAFTGGDVTSNLTLTAACSPYHITDDIYVDGNAILTIEPGVTLSFDQDVVLNIGYSSSAKLVAVGTAVNTIKFTSALSTPGAGDWAGIKLWDGTMAGTTIGYASVDYCGQARSACIFGGTNVKANRVTIDHVKISNVGAGANGIEEDGDASNFAISNCTFSDILSAPTQQYAISVPAASFAGIDSTNLFNRCSSHSDKSTTGAA